MAGMRIAVTGASGNLGSALLRTISAARGTHTVLGISRRPPRNADSAAPVADAWLALDLSLGQETPRLTQALAGCDAVVHLAWKLQPGHDEQQLWQTNVAGTANLLRAATDANVPHVVVITSVGAYSPGAKTEEVDETWPTRGISTSSYSRHKADVERLLDSVELRHPDLLVTRIRPGLVFQAGAASEISRLFLGSLVPSRLIGRIPLPPLPLPSSLVFQAVHADDVASAIWSVLRHRAPGAFNVASDPVLTPDDLATAVRAVHAVPIPAGLLRMIVALTWHARLQPTGPGWIDLATRCPIMSTARLRALGWQPSRTSLEALQELVTGLREGRGDPAYPPLAPATGSAGGG
jgi:UDP-glucose 4-epimerase